MRYSPALDGLRGVAIGLVICGHTMRQIFPLAGWIGVDVFFVLSGYLITSILLRELQETGQISFCNFYARRALRLFPALAILVTAQFIRSAFSHNGHEIREATLVSVAYIENWNMIFSYWPTGDMGHTWSLATEEQFYLLWPLALVFLMNRGPLAWLTASVAAMTAAELLFWHGGGSGTEHALQYSLGIRPVGLLIGAALAFGKWRLPAWTAPVALLTIGVVALTADRSASIFLAAPLAVSLATAALIVCTSQASPVTDMLSFAPLRYVGKISYGLYLYHVPIFLFGEEHKIHLSFYLYGVGLIVLMFAAAILSYEFIEKPILGLKRRFPREIVALPAEGLNAA